MLLFALLNEEYRDMNKVKNWFKDWFNTPYYHQLYNHRDDHEAEFFIENLIAFLQLEKGSKLLDLPCGRGRHSVFLNKLGFEVVGADLSENNIKFAKKFENKTLRFTQHDMREDLRNQYHTIFNLFTSFGYFDEDETNIEVMKKFRKGLLKHGKIVLDFLNIYKIERQLVQTESIVKDAITFNISRSINQQFLIKTIDFEDHGQLFHFEEQVRSYSLEDFERMAALAGLKIKHVFGDYQLNEFDQINSDRLILILQ